VRIASAIARAAALRAGFEREVERTPKRRAGAEGPRPAVLASPGSASTR
jgi:hypothetical protein